MALADSSPLPGGSTKLASSIARRIESEILAARRPIGSVIGSETDLLDRYAVSRAVFREAVRIVEHSGLATMRRGPGGGLIVTQPDRRGVSTALAIWFSYVGVTVQEMFETRMPLQLAAARLAAEQIDERGIEELRAALDDLERRPVFDLEAFSNFEMLVVELSRNPVLHLFANALLDTGMSRVRGTRARLEPPITPDDSLRHLRGYQRLSEAIIRGDGGAAQVRMQVLLNALQARLQDRPARARRRSVTIDGGSGKLAERLAAVIRDDIERAGWPVGEVLGSEAELIERYRISRAILREAVRILEHHRAVRTKRGPGGGLVVAEPDGGSVGRAAEVALEYEGLTSAHLLEARAALEVASVRLATERCTEKLANELRATLAAEAAAPLSSDVFNDVHRRVAVASGNRPLALFISVLADLTGLHVRNTLDGRVKPDHVRRAHAAIVDAVITGDAALAQHRMLRHLDATAATIR